MRALLFKTILLSAAIGLLGQPANAQDETILSNVETTSSDASVEQTVPEDAQTAVEATSNAVCIPPCREGYTCRDGKCLSRCNPSCPADYRCTDRLECVNKERTVYLAPPQEVYSAYKRAAVYAVDSRARYRAEIREYREKMREYRDRNRRLIRFFIVPTLFLALQPKMKYSTKSSRSYGLGIGLGVTKHFTRVVGFQSRFVTGFFIMSESDRDFLDDIPEEDGLDLSLDATALIGPFGPFFMEAGMVGSYREYFRGEVLIDEDDEYSWTRLPAKQDAFAVGAVAGFGFMMGDESQYVVGGRLFVQSETDRFLMMRIYFSYVFGNTGDKAPARPYF